MSGQRTQEIDVLVVGGGLVGLTAALVLRHHGVPVLLAEKHATTSPQPKARRFHMRSMEIFRELGLAETVHEAARDLAGHDHMAAGRTLAEAEQLPLWNGGRSAAGAPAGAPLEVSPELPCLIAQDLLEPVLRRAGEDAGADVRFETELTGFAQHEDCVAARLLDRRSGTEREVRARYLLAADGSRSPVRETIGIGRSGRGALGGVVASVYFTADLADVVRGREFNLCQIEHPEACGTLASIDGRRRWVFAAPAAVPDEDAERGAASVADRATRGEPVRDWPAILRTALGVPAPDLTVASVLTWRPEMLVADRYSAGRVHLLGDAAHVMPPFAASGANTGIADAHNIGWKIAAVLRGEAAPELLDSYDAERRPAGWFTADQSARRAASLRSMNANPDPSLAHHYVLAVGGCRYTDGAIARDQVSADDPEPVTEFAPAGRVGTRVPHCWLDTARTRSTIDAAGPSWAILSGGGKFASGSGGLPAYRITCGFLAAGESLLLRPDHIVAWRGADTDASVPSRVRAAILGGSRSA